MRWMQSSSSRLWLGVLVLLLLTVVVALTYSYVLCLDFAGSDTLYLIETSRIGGWRDLHGIFGVGIMGGEFYRPVAQLSYSLDYVLSRTHPAGYHVTGLWLHLAVTLQLALLARRWGVPGKWAGAGLCGVLFALHPILVESVPAVARRHDILAAAFGLLAILLSDCTRPHGTLWQLILIGIPGLLALGSKEIAVLVPPLAILAAWLRPHWRNSRNAKQRLTVSLTWIALLAFFLVWRQTRGAVGVDLRIALGDLGETWGTTTTYFSGLVCPSVALEEGAQTALALGAICSLLGLVGAVFFQRSSPRFFALGGAWVLGGGCLLALTGQSAPRNLYLPAGGAALLIGGTLADLGTRLTGGHRGERPTVRMMVMPLAAGVIALGWVLASPLLNAYPGWRTSSELTRAVLDLSSEVARLLPHQSTLYVVNLPKAVISPTSSRHERSVSVMRDHSVQSWLAMNYPEHVVEVQVCSYRDVSSDQGQPPLLTNFYGDAAVIIVANKPEEREAPWSFFWHDICQVAVPDPEEALRAHLPQDAHRVNAYLEESPVLEGYSLARRMVEPGHTLSLILYWRATQPISGSYTVFVHLLSSTGELQAQHDGLPVSGTYPTDQWVTSTIIADGHAIFVDSSTPPGRYTLVAGMYNIQTGERLAAVRADGERWQDDAVVLGEVQIGVTR